MSKLLIFLILAAIPFMDSAVPFPEFPQSGPSALSAIQQNPFDSLLWDARMAGKGQEAMIPLPEATIVSERSEVAVHAPSEGRAKGEEIGVGESDNGDTGMAISAANRAGSRENPGLAVQGIATYYWSGLAGNVMRDNVTLYDPQASGAVAAVSWPLSSVLYVCGPSKRCITVTVSDTGYLQENALDLSESDFQVLSGLGLGPGVIEVRIRRCKRHETQQRNTY